MKKIFFSFLAVAALASCAKTEAVYVENTSEIKIVPATAIATKANQLGAINEVTYPVTENFDVYGYWSADWANETNPVTYLLTDGTSGVEFVNKGRYWGGATPYHWPKDGSLQFAAYSPSSVDLAHAWNGDIYSKEGYVQPSETDKTWDLLLAQTTEAYTAHTAAENVSVVFEHALSWITLQVKAKDATAAQAFEIKKVTINQVNTQANLSAAMTAEGVPANAWSAQADPKDMVVFSGSQKVNEEVAVIESTNMGTLVIPQATTQVTINYTQRQFGGTAQLENQTIVLDLVLDTDESKWLPGKHYTYTLVFGLDEILINPSVAGWESINVGELEADNTTHNVSTAAQLDAALAKGGKIVFQANIAGVFNVPEFENQTLVIDGNGFELNGAFHIVGNSSYTNSYTVFKNINFVAADASALAVDAFIYCNEQNGGTRYPDSVSIENCTFTATDAVKNTAVAAKFRSLQGTVSIGGATATGLHSLLQMASSGDAYVKVYDATIVDCKNGISLDNTSAIIKNSNIQTAEYGIRANGDRGNATLEVVETSIESTKPIIVRKLTSATYNVALEDAVLVAGQPYDVVFTKGSDDAAFAVPTGKFNITGDEDFVVFPTANANQLMNALAASAEIELVSDLDLTDVVWAPVGTKENMFTGVLNGNGHKISGLALAGDYAALIAYAGENAVVKDVTFENVNVESTKYGAAVVCVAGNNVTIENVIVSGTVNATAYAAGLVLMNNQDSDKVIIKNCVNNATVTSQRAGGLAAWVTGGSEFENVVNNGDVTGTISACGITNRIAGTIKNAKNYGKITGAGTEASAGIAGTQTAASTFEYCYNYGDVTTTANNANASAAGILGQTPGSAATLNYCANYGAITAEQSYAAGIAYSLYGNINASYCYNAGAVNGAKAAGAIAPKAQYGANDTAKYCLNAGEITSAGKVYQGSNKNTSCYYYSNGTLMNVAGNAVVAEADALAVLNGGADADFFALVDGKVVVK